MISKKLVWKLIDSDINKYPDGATGVPSKSTMEKVLKLIPVEVDKDFLNYLKTYGGGEIGSNDIYGLTNLREDELLLSQTNSKENEHIIKEYCGFKGDYIVISNDGCGNPYFMDKNNTVWLADFDTASGLHKVADGFLEFVWKECYDEEMKELFLGEDYTPE